MERRLIAPWWHTGIVLMILGAVVLLGMSASAQDTGHGGIPLYLSVACFEWVMFGITYLGTRKRATLRELIGVRWSWRRTLITLVFWVIWECTDKAMHWLLHSGEPANLAAMLPQTAAEIFCWVVVSVSAGICEEFIYRGYLQRQFAALTRSTTIGVILQAIAFGASHSYQGWKQVITISVLGALYGVLVQWQGSILPGMVSHAWADIYGGWLNP